MKEKCCFVAQDVNLQSTIDQLDDVHVLPDGKELWLGALRHRCAEALFPPELIGLEGLSLPELVSRSIRSCDSDVRSALYGNIVLSGGTMGMPGIRKRVIRQLAMLVPPSTTIGVAETVSQPQSLVWLGGS